MKSTRAVFYFHLLSTTCFLSLSANDQPIPILSDKYANEPYGRERGPSVEWTSRDTDNTEAQIKRYVPQNFDALKTSEMMPKKPDDHEAGPFSETDIKENQSDQKHQTVRNNRKFEIDKSPPNPSKKYGSYIMDNPPSITSGYQLTNTLIANENNRLVLRNSPFEIKDKLKEFPFPISEQSVDIQAADTPTKSVIDYDKTFISQGNSKYVRQSRFVHKPEPNDSKFDGLLNSNLIYHTGEYEIEDKVNGNAFNAGTNSKSRKYLASPSHDTSNLMYVKANEDEIHSLQNDDSVMNTLMSINSNSTLDRSPLGENFQLHDETIAQPFILSNDPYDYYGVKSPLSSNQKLHFNSWDAQNLWNDLNPNQYLGERYEKSVEIPKRLLTIPETVNYEYARKLSFASDFPRLYNKRIRSLPKMNHSIIHYPQNDPERIHSNILSRSLKDANPEKSNYLKITSDNFNKPRYNMINYLKFKRQASTRVTNSNFFNSSHPGWTYMKNTFPDKKKIPGKRVFTKEDAKRNILSKKRFNSIYGGPLIYSNLPYDDNLHVQNKQLNAMNFLKFDTSGKQNLDPQSTGQNNDLPIKNDNAFMPFPVINGKTTNSNSNPQIAIPFSKGRGPNIGLQDGNNDSFIPLSTSKFDSDKNVSLFFASSTASTPARSSSAPLQNVSGSQKSTAIRTELAFLDNFSRNGNDTIVYPSNNITAPMGNSVASYEEAEWDKEFSKIQQLLTHPKNSTTPFVPDQKDYLVPTYIKIFILLAFVYLFQFAIFYLMYLLHSHFKKIRGVGGNELKSSRKSKYGDLDTGTNQSKGASEANQWGVPLEELVIQHV